MGNINTLRTDLDKQLHGTWVPYAEGIELKIARWGNEKFLEAQRAAIEQRQVVLHAKELSEDQRLDANKEAASRTILLDWRNLEDDGVPVVYSPEQALAYFRDPELATFWTFVFLQSLEEANFRKARLEAGLKNSPPS
jgi:hypothetical protein